MTEVERWQVRVTGVVQGVGFRPFVHALASEYSVTGFVGNDPGGVFIEVQGPAETIDTFADALRTRAPRLARVEAVVAEPMSIELDETTFAIAPSRNIIDDDVALLPPDTSTCSDCAHDVSDQSNRRYDYPFTACTHCGPRFTIVRGLPYDRPNTTMSEFPLCAECQREYDDPTDRRFHAQPVACPNCGPHAWFSGGGSLITSDKAAIATAAAKLAVGRIVAIKGIGGYHLTCNASDSLAVAELRKRKGRGSKPFAVMVADAAAAETLVTLSDEARRLLESPAAPIVIAPTRDTSAATSLGQGVAPGSDVIGVMLAYTPLHAMLFAALPTSVHALIMTSANLSDEPICTDPVEAEARLSNVADAFLHHDRPIQAPCDDSVVRPGVGIIRRSRGYVPTPLRLPFESPQLLAVGGELKATGAVARGRHVWLTQHVGDVGSLETAQALNQALAVTSSLARVAPEAVVADLHPGYLSQRWARERANSLGVPMQLVQHHHAHLASLLAEHEVPLGEPVLGFTFDGTGFGLDGTIWGGELLLGSYDSVDRVGHLRSIQLPGGDAATRRPPRVAVAHLVAADLDASSAACDRAELDIVTQMLTTGVGCTPTTSMGRLFDAVSSLLGVCQTTSYEGQAAIELESLARTTATAATDFAFDLDESGDGLIIDPTAMFTALLSHVRAGRPAADAALAFHEALAAVILAAANKVRSHTGVATVGLSGGVFSNEILVRLASNALSTAGFRVLTHERVPANDGGLALGQLAVAACGGCVASSITAEGN
jgi:hydrogenase maturation protein HypF